MKDIINFYISLTYFKISNICLHLANFLKIIIINCKGINSFKSMKVINLRPDPKLLSNFDTYKLSLASVPVLKISEISVLRIKTDQFSLAHSTLFQLHNHLSPDPWLSNVCYFISQDFSVERVHYNLSNGKLAKSSSSVYKIQDNKIKSQEIYNPELKFVSEKFVLLSDGHGGLDLIETGDRKDELRWKRVETFQPLEGSSFILKDVKFKVEEGEKIIHCLLLHIEQINEKSHNIVNWITIKEDVVNKKWNFVARRTIQGKGAPLYYLSFDTHCQGIFNDFSLNLNSLNFSVCNQPIFEISIFRHCLLIKSSLPLHIRLRQ